MDTDTLLAYNNKAGTFAADWLAQPAPDDMYAMLTQYFTPGPTADIGCGAGRDTAWLNTHGFETVGYDVSVGLLREARAAYPALTFEQAALPALSGMTSGSFQNILCETVIMHLEADQVAAAMERLLDLLKPGGTLFVSWRVTEGTSLRDAHGRLYSAFDERRVLDACETHQVLMNKVEISGSSGKKVQRVVVRK